MMRLGGVIAKNREYDVEYNDDSLISKNTFDTLNDFVSYVPLNAGILAMDLEGFSSFVVELSFACFPDETIEDALKTVMQEYLYPNLMYLFPNLARNYKENVRTFLKPKAHDGFDLEASMQNFKQNNKNYKFKQNEIKLVDFDKDANRKIFDLKSKKNDQMLQNPIKITGLNQNDEILISQEDEDDIKERRKTKIISPSKSPKHDFYDSPALKYQQTAIDERRKTQTQKLEERKKRIEDKKKMIEIMRQQMANNKISGSKGCKRYILKCVECFTKCCGKCKSCLVKTFVLYPKQAIKYTKKKFLELSKRLGFIDEEDMLEAEHEKLKVFFFFFNLK